MSSSLKNKNMGKIARLLGFLCIVVLSCTGCKRDYQTFQYTFTLESVSNYKLTFAFSDKKEYRTEVANYFMSRGMGEPTVKAGLLTEEQYAYFYGLLKESDLFSMKDSYGFEEETGNENDLLAQITFTADGKTKYISIRNLSRISQDLPKSFRQLMTGSVEFIK